jgi:hypothetical protein
LAGDYHSDSNKAQSEESRFYDIAYDPLDEAVLSQLFEVELLSRELLVSEWIWVRTGMYLCLGSLTQTDETGTQSVITSEAFASSSLSTDSTGVIAKA